MPIPRASSYRDPTQEAKEAKYYRTLAEAVKASLESQGLSIRVKTYGEPHSFVASTNPRKTQLCIKCCYSRNHSIHA